MALTQATVRAEDLRLLNWWCEHSVDDKDGGFYGEIDDDGRPVLQAPKSAILNSRLLWYFSASARKSADELSTVALGLAHRAFAYMREHFLDPDHGGIYWMLDHKGQVIDAKKQAYAQAFAIYGFAEYYLATQDPAALKIALNLQRDIGELYWDKEHGGYLEALAAWWSQPPKDQRLSDRDVDCPKTMNTHLHILEAFTLLHRAARDETTHAALYRALTVFIEHFVDRNSGHLRLFFDLDWSDRTETVSFGHDIEASWLIWEAALVLGEKDLIEWVRPLTLGLAEVTLKEGLNAWGGISYECRFEGEIDPHGEWWCQAEGMVGFVNAWELTHNKAYLSAANGIWRYVEAEFGAGQGNEWSWYPANAVDVPLKYKAGMWKCPYHNGRAMMELHQRLVEK